MRTNSRTTTDFSSVKKIEYKQRVKCNGDKYCKVYLLRIACYTFLNEIVGKVIGIMSWCCTSTMTTTTTTITAIATFISKYENRRTQ